MVYPVWFTYSINPLSDIPIRVLCYIISDMIYTYFLGLQWYGYCYISSMVIYQYCIYFGASWRFASYFQSLLVQVLWSVNIINCTWVVIPSLFSYNYIYNYIYMVSPLLTFSNSPISVVSKSVDIISSNFLVWFYIVAMLYVFVTFIWSLPSLVRSVL